MRLTGCITCGVLLMLMGCRSKADIAPIVRKADIVYDSAWFQQGYSHVPLYVANGIIGGCFDHMGFQSRPNTGMPEGRTALGYIRHYDKIARGRNIQFPLAYIKASFTDGSPVYNLVDARDYRQELDLYTGVLTTRYDLYGKTEINAFASQQHPNLFVYHINRQSDNPAKKIILSIECETSVCQNNDTKSSVVKPVTVSIDIEKDLARVRSVTAATTTDWLVSCPGAGFEIKGTTLLVYLNNGENDIRLLVNHPKGSPENILQEKYESLVEAHSKIWAEEWSKSWIDIPEARVHNTWTRMKYYTICNFPTIAEKAMIPEGLTSNIWGFTFPQDVYYVAENLPRTGLYERSEKALQYWLDILPEVRKYSLRTMGVEGAYYPWTPPYQDWNEFEKEGVLNPDSYELHNPAYVAAMVWHYYKYSNDTAVLKKYYPVIKGVFEFYKNISARNAEGTYDIYHINARGQDEASSVDGRLRNLLCAGYSAEYMANMIVNASKIAGDTTWLTAASDMASKGMNRSKLLQANGIYSTYEGDNRPMNSQKHPVQLNPITYLPMGWLAGDSTPTAKAWKNRYDLTVQAKKPFTAGWTLGDFYLASTRMRSPSEARKDLDAIQPCHGADPMWIQFYESSFWERWHVMKAYYFPMHALYEQAITDALVQDWRGYTDVFACLQPEWKETHLAFSGIRTLGGAEVSGEWDKGKFKIEIKPGKAKKIELRISQDAEVTAKGIADGPGSFKGNTNVSFSFRDDNVIILKGKTNAH